MHTAMKGRVCKFCMRQILESSLWFWLGFIFGFWENLLYFIIFVIVEVLNRLLLWM